MSLYIPTLDCILIYAIQCKNYETLYSIKAIIVGAVWFEPNYLSQVHLSQKSFEPPHMSHSFKPQLFEPQLFEPCLYEPRSLELHSFEPQSFEPKTYCLSFSNG